jgi:large subunit ribosomal protein L18
MAGDTNKRSSRLKRAKRVRAKIRGTVERPRLTIFRSNKNIFAQIIDDRKGITLVAASTLDKDFRKKPGEAFNKDKAKQVGQRLAVLAKEKNILKVVFDRGAYLYHGKIKALADGAREGGLNF